jgi:hypothetical protein
MKLARNWRGIGAAWVGESPVCANSLHFLGNGADELAHSNRAVAANWRGIGAIGAGGNAA